MSPGATRSKVKSGCRTCKTRRVKCDEGWPACRRCLSTGRVCEGYGIWGGGGNDYGRRTIGPPCNKNPRGFNAPLLMQTNSREESRHLEWFTYRTAFKLPGVFSFAFWDTLVFQAASNEPAVLHAVLALSSVHKRDGFYVSSLDTDHPDEQERFTLQHYSRAITHLQPHFSAKSNSSIRVALITCIMFVLMEFLRGHYKTGNAHLQNGLKLLDEFQARSSGIDSYSLFLEPCCDSVDAWIIQAFLRLDVQAKLLGYGSQHLRMVLDDTISRVPNLKFTFQSFNQARQHLDRLYCQIFHINHECRRQGWPRDQVYTDDLLFRQHNVKNALASWYQAFRASCVSLVTKKLSTSTVAQTLIRIHYTMAEIMADTCLWPADESRYDAHTEDFHIMMEQLTTVRALSQMPSLSKIMHFPDMSGSVADLGALAALYFVIGKCRVHKIRHEALGFLSETCHKEGIWNAVLIASIAQEIVRIEEGDFYTDCDVANEAASVDDGSNADSKEPVLPESYRLHDVEVELPESYAGIATIKCKRRLDGDIWEVITRDFVYNVPTQSWVRS
ncbi:uncharacterized protein F4822DRAFT_387855 [Hypoxylon trugodes]|uniref:uncharacterized protein n=1 Tax=Hypoxylon trugodes TaxID=326681 RepID=UPI00218DCBCE|nr:uncharacterized protein F4822DRAFT_387855 [Hypoxylon trugodes]KAI1394300.1 hypothetical protein F4822DRAFT_387855 [Hypoxylon trugodes]